MSYVGMTRWESEAIEEINPNAKWTAKGIDNINWLEDTAPISKEDILAKASELEQADTDAKTKKEADKASAKAKLISGEALTEDEANTIVL